MRSPENPFSRRVLPAAAVAAAVGGTVFVLLNQEPAPSPAPAPSIEAPTAKPDKPHPECSQIQVEANQTDHQKFNFQLVTKDLDVPAMWAMQDVEYDYGDGGPSEYSSAIASGHTYGHPGSYKVSAIIHMDSAGAPINKTNTVNCPPVTVEVPAS